MPTTYFSPPVGSVLFSGAALGAELSTAWEPAGALLSAPGLPEQAARDRDMTSASSSAVSFAVFFILYSSKQWLLYRFAPPKRRWHKGMSLSAHGR
jgi:hypothetical protein